jgi:hypothetical protein
MQPIFDNLNALIIGGILILTLSVTQGRSQRAGIEQIASHSVKAKTLVFGHWVERDVLNLGANVGRNTFRFEDPVVDARGNTTRWTFYSDSVRVDGSVLRRVVRYRLVETTQAAFRDTTYQLYEVRRDSATVAVRNGVPDAVRESDWPRGMWSIGTLSFFQIDLLDRSGTTPRQPSGAVDVDKADYVRIRFGVVPEYVLRPDNYIRELYWVRTMKVRPYWSAPVCRPPACSP